MPEQQSSSCGALQQRYMPFQLMRSPANKLAPPEASTGSVASTASCSSSTSVETTMDYLWWGHAPSSATQQQALGPPEDECVPHCEYSGYGITVPKNNRNTYADGTCGGARWTPDSGLHQRGHWEALEASALAAEAAELLLLEADSRHPGEVFDIEL